MSAELAPLLATNIVSQSYPIYFICELPTTKTNSHTSLLFPLERLFQLDYNLRRLAFIPADTSNHMNKKSNNQPELLPFGQLVESVMPKPKWISGFHSEVGLSLICFFFYLSIMLFGNAQIMLKITSKFCKRVYITLIPISQHIRLRPISEGDIIEIYPLQKLTSH